MKRTIRRIIINLIDDGSDIAMVVSNPLPNELHKTIELHVLGIPIAPDMQVERWAINMLMMTLTRPKPNMISNVDPPPITVDVPMIEMDAALVLDGMAVKRIREAAKKTGEPK